MSSNQYVRSGPSMDFASVQLEQSWTSSALAVLQRSFDFAEHLHTCGIRSNDSNVMISGRAPSSEISLDSVEPTVFHCFLGGVSSLLSTTIQQSITNFYVGLSTTPSKHSTATNSPTATSMNSGRERVAQERDRLQRSNVVVRQLATSMLNLYFPVLLALSSPNRKLGNAARSGSSTTTESIVESTTKITRVGLQSFLSPNVLHMLNDLETRTIDQRWYQTLLKFSLQTSLGIWSLLCMASGSGLTYWNSRWSALHQLAYETRIRQAIIVESTLQVESTPAVSRNLNEEEQTPRSVAFASDSIEREQSQQHTKRLTAVDIDVDGNEEYEEPYDD